MITRRAHARWEGNLREGQGEVDFGQGAFSAPYSFASRFDDDDGTTPEELLSAAHASCFAMCMSRVLSDAGFKPEFFEVTARVTISNQEGGFSISRSHLICEARIPGITATTFAGHAENARTNCLISKALAGTQITLESRLRGG
ncbi:MAG: OsmC family peroxiredoxin [Pseudomonadota bacterium]